MTSVEKVVLVTGATGRQGGAVVRHMLPKGWKLRALTRSPDYHGAKGLARKGVEVVRGDLEDAASLDRAPCGVYGIYSVQDFWSVGAKREVQQRSMSRLQLRMAGRFARMYMEKGNGLSS